MPLKHKSRYEDATTEYYAQWVDTEPFLLQSPGLHFILSTKRDVMQQGYPTAYQLYCIVTKTSVLVSYSDRLEESVPKLAGVLDERLDTATVKAALEQIFCDHDIGHGLKFCFSSVPEELDTSHAVQLRCHDFREFRRFFLTQHGPAAAGDGLREYFESLSDRHYSYGVFDDGHLVSATDAPAVPYMSDVIVEIGANTLQPYRGRGYAKICVGAMLRYLVQQGRVPIWSTGEANKASIHLAQTVGFSPFADVFMISLDG